MRFVALLLFFSVLFCSCEKDKPAIVVDGQTEGSVILKINHKFGNEDFNVNQSYVLDDGNRVKFSGAAFYLSGFKLMNNETIHEFTDQYILCKDAQQQFVLGQMSPDNFTSFSFGLGLNEAVNHADPSLYPADHPLALQLQSMHWGWNSGYIFVMLEGVVDTSQTQVDNFNHTFTYHIGTDALFYPEVVFQKEITISKGVSTVVEITLDYKKIWNGIDIKNRYVTMSFNDFPLARTVRDNFINAME